MWVLTHATGKCVGFCYFFFIICMSVCVCVHVRASAWWKQISQSIEARSLRTVGNRVKNTFVPSPGHPLGADAQAAQLCGYPETKSLLLQEEQLGQRRTWSLIKCIFHLAFLSLACYYIFSWLAILRTFSQSMMGDSWRAGSVQGPLPSPCTVNILSSGLQL